MLSRIAVLPYWFAAVIAGLLILTESPAAASMALPRIVDKSEYKSEDGTWRLTVEPSDRHGKGSADYWMVHDGAEAWRRTLSFTLLDPTVLKDGTVIGTAYTQSLQSYNDNPGEIVVAVLDSNGMLRLEDHIARKPNLILDSVPDPTLREIHFEPSTDTLLIRLRKDANSPGELWRVYAFSTGEKLSEPDVIPEECGRGRVWVKSAVMIEDVPLVLVSWQCWQEQTGVDLVDYSGQTVWRDVGEILDSKPEVEIESSFRLDKEDHTQILGVGKRAGRYLVWKEGNEVLPSPTEEASTPTPSPPLAPQLPAINLEQLGTVSIDGVLQESPDILKHVDFDFDETGNLAVLRPGDSQSSATLSLIRPTGEELHAIDLPQLKTKNRILHRQGSDYFLVISGSGRDKEAKIYSVNIESGYCSKLPIKGLTSIQGADALGDKLVLLTRTFGKNTISDDLYGFESSGAQLWHIEEGHSREAGKLFSPEDVCITSNGEVVVLDNVGKFVQIFTLDGKFVDSLNLEKTWGWKPNYPTNITAAPGGFIIRDFNGPKSLVITRRDGTSAQGINLHYADGFPFDARTVKYAPSGALWASDRRVLMKLDANGTAIDTIGAPSEDPPIFLDQLEFGPDGKLYGVDRRTWSVVVYTQEGQLLHKCIPNADDFSPTVSTVNLSIRSDGNVFISDNMNYQNPAYLEFDSEGNRLGWSAIGLGHGKQDWKHQPATDMTWVSSFDKLHLVKADGTVEKVVERNADNTWIRGIYEMHAGADGSLATRQGGVSLFSPDGEPTATIALPTDKSKYWRIGYNGRYLVACSGREMLIYTAEGSPIGKATTNDEGDVVPLMPLDRNEIWLWKKGTSTLTKMALPPTEKE